MPSLSTRCWASQTATATSECRPQARCRTPVEPRRPCCPRCWLCRPVRPVAPCAAHSPALPAPLRAQLVANLIRAPATARAKTLSRWERLSRLRGRAADGLRPRPSLPCTKCCASLKAAFAKATASTTFAHIGEICCGRDVVPEAIRQARGSVNLRRSFRDAATDPPARNCCCGQQLQPPSPLRCPRQDVYTAHALALCGAPVRRRERALDGPAWQLWLAQQLLPAAETAIGACLAQKRARRLRGRRLDRV